ncbi:MAG TPA: polysaccharide biosynthesis tyrosine autokinase [Methylomirabilota bacterium]|nr:polysaccharide biosynthesis tyrosine autokinase [Methylomirabilota bacterium]
MEPNKTDANKFTTAPETKLHFLDYWRIIRIRKTVILAVFLLVALTTTVVTYLLPPAYSSRALISIEQDMPDVAAREQAFYYRSPADPFFIQTEFQRIQSKPVLYKVIEDLKLREEWGRKYKQPTALPLDKTYDILKGSIDVRQQHNTTLVEIHAFSDDKEEAARLANTVADVYAKVRNKARFDIAQGGLDSLREELKRVDKEITDKQADVNKLRQEMGISDYEAAGNAPTPSLDQETLRRISDALLEAQDRFVQASNRWATLDNLPRQQLKDAAPLQVADPRLNDLINKENDTAQRLATVLGRGLGENNPDVVATRELLHTISNQLDGALSGLLIGLKTEMQNQLARLQHYAERQSAARRQDSTNYSITRPYYVAKEELMQKKFFRDRVAQNLELTAIEAKAPTAGSVQVIEDAEKVDRPYRPNKKLNIGLGIAVGLLIGIGLAFFIEYLDTSVKTIDDVERALQAPVLGVIPQNVGVLIEEGPESPHAEAYRVLRTNVLFSRKDPKLNTLTVVSGGAGEGKSTTIFNLATVFAQNGQRVLIIDSDLRRPSLHKYLRISNSIGLTNYLLKQNTLEEVIQTTSQQNMDFLPSGRLPSSSMGILSSIQMKELIRDVKRRYDFVFFDSPPIMGVSDASVLASEVDMVLQVIQYRRYPQPMTIRAKQMIEKVGGNLLGIVLNNINVSQDENYYYYSGYYYDYYNKGEYGEYKSHDKKVRGEYRSRDSKPESKSSETNGQETKVEVKSKF